MTVAPTYIDARKAKARRLWPGFRKDGGDCRSPADSHVELFSTLFSKLRHLLSPLRLATRNLPFCDPSVPPHTCIFYIYIYIYIEASFCSRTRSFQNICALGNGCIRVCSVMCNQSVYTHCVTGHVDIKPEGTKTIRFLLRLHW